MIPDNFGALEKGFSSTNAKVFVLPVGYEGTVTYGKGASKGPKAMIEASKNMELYDEELDSEPYLAGIHTLNDLSVKKDNVEKAIEKVENSVKNWINKNKFPVVLGGEHSISLGAVRAFKEKFNDLSVLQIDAHSDLRDSYDKSKFNHACVMRRIVELCPIVQVGIRSQDISEVEFIKEKKLKNIFYAKDIYDNDRWFDKAIGGLSSNVYLTIDLDGLDPSIMPSTGTPEPGGLSWYGLLKFLRKVFSEKNIVGFDVVELAPNKNNVAPDFMAAKLVYKIIGYKFKK
ncbi:agmatinase [Candidatus Woesearchaeota archaeon]|nr:agmatinase [Candidatus Woesearchaeota archaeon]